MFIWVIVPAICFLAATTYCRHSSGRRWLWIWAASAFAYILAFAVPAHLAHADPRATSDEWMGVDFFQGIISLGALLLVSILTVMVKQKLVTTEPSRRAIQVSILLGLITPMLVGWIWWGSEDRLIREHQEIRRQESEDLQIGAH